MNLLEQQRLEIEALKSKIKEQAEKISLQEKEIAKNEEKLASLEKLNHWYIEQLKLRQQKKFGVSSEKADQDQISIADAFSDLFNEAEVLKQPIVVEPEQDTVIPEHKRKKAKRGSKFDTLPVETIEYKLSDEEKVCANCGSPLTEMKKETRKEYALNQKEYLSNFLKDERIQLSNNLAEQSIKMFVIGRKNWLFSNTPNGANASSIIYSIIQTAIANNLRPMHYLEYVFEQL